MQPDIQVLLARHVDGSLKGLGHHQLQQWLVHICQQLQPTNTDLSEAAVLLVLYASSLGSLVYYYAAH